MRTPSSTGWTRWRSPDSRCPSRASVATPQWTSVCTSRTRLGIGPLPLAHRDPRAMPRPIFNAPVSLSIEEGEAFFEVERGGDPLEGQPELDHGEGDLGLDPDDHRLRPA